MSLLGADRHTALPHLLLGLLDQTTVSRAALSPSSEGQSLSFSSSSLTLSGDFDTYKMATQSVPREKDRRKAMGPGKGVADSMDRFRPGVVRAGSRGLHT